jgi:hypothetical protein
MTEFSVDPSKKIFQGLLASFEDLSSSRESLKHLASLLEEGTFSSDDKNRVFDLLLNLLETQQEKIKLTLLEFPVEHLDLDVERNHLWIREILFIRESLTSDNWLREIDYRLRCLLPDSLDILKEHARYTSVGRERLFALDFLLHHSPDEKFFLLDLRQLLLDLEEQRELDRGLCFLFQGRLWARKNYPSDLRNKEVSSFLKDLWRKSRTVDRFEAFSGAVGNLSPVLAERIIQVVTDLFEKRLPLMLKKKSSTAFTALENALIEERYLVAGLKCCQAIFSRKDFEVALIQNLLDLLMQLWEELSDGQVSLGPQGTRQLVRALLAFCRHHPDASFPVISALIDEMEFLEVQKGILDLWSLLETDALKKIASWLIEQARHPHDFDAEEDLKILFLLVDRLQAGKEKISPEEVRKVAYAFNTSSWRRRRK